MNFSLNRIKVKIISCILGTILTYPLVDYKVKRKTIFNNKNNEISLYNILIAGHSHEFSYSCNKNSLEELISGRIKPGFVENKYYEEYEKPCELYRNKNGGYFN